MKDDRDKETMVERDIAWKKEWKKMDRLLIRGVIKETVTRAWK